MVCNSAATSRARAAGATMAAVPPPRAAALAPFTAWLLAGGVQMNGVEVAWLGGAMGAGLVATRDLPTGAVACRVPRSLLLTVTSGLTDPELGQVLSELQNDLEDERNNLDASAGIIALQLLYAAAQAQRGEPNRWAPYVDCLPRELNTPVLWPRSLRETLLAGTSLLTDTRELRAAVIGELRRVRRRLLQHGQAGWMARFGLDVATPCPLTGSKSSAAERWLLAQSLVRSRAYVILDDGEDGHGALEELLGDELVMAPLVDLDNHDDALRGGILWGDGEGAPPDQLTVTLQRPAAVGEQVSVSYGCHSRAGSLLAFGFFTDAQRPSFAYRLAVDRADPHAEQKVATLHAAGLGSSGTVSFELPSEPPDVSGVSDAKCRPPTPRAQPGGAQQ